MDPPFPLDLRPDDKTPLHRQVYVQIRAAILTGRVRSHSKLPASRQLARALGISRTTVTESYDQLISEGYLETRRGAGTFVSADIPDTLLGVGIEGQDTNILSQPSVNRTAPKSSLSTYAQRLLQATPTPQPTKDSHKNKLSFRYWQPDLSLFPTKQWQRLVNRHALSGDTRWMTYDADPMGYRPLREAITAYIGQVRAVRAHPDQILITQGTQQALGLIAQVLMNEGAAIALENPGYLSARKVFMAHGALPVHIPVDDEGLIVEALYQRTSAPIKLAYVTPSHQFPTGALMSLPRRIALLEWANQTNGWIIEDDYDSEFRYDGRPVPALQGLDPDQNVLYVGTFSKVMFPGLRLGYIVLPPALVEAFRRAKWVCDRQSSLLNQAALSDFITEGLLARHIRRMRSVYAQRREVLVGALQQLSPIEISGDPAGLHLMAKLPVAATGLSDKQLMERAAESSVSLFSVAAYDYLSRHSDQPQRTLPGRDYQGHFIFGFGGLTASDITTAIERLAPLFSS
ncbi:MAG: PLP-dependent aminotransferase family protein [Cyanobacteria bacterium J06581_3]